MNHDTRTMNPKPPTNRNRRRSHSILRWSDVQVGITFTAFAAASWVVGYGITTLVFMFGERY
jgi:hypothetical protein